MSYYYIKQRASFTKLPNQTKLNSNYTRLIPGIINKPHTCPFLVTCQKLLSHLNHLDKS